MILPDPDELDNEISFERSCRRIKSALERVITRCDTAISIADALNQCASIFMADGLGQEEGHAALQSKPVLEAMRVLIRDKIIMRVDGDTFCAYGKRPKYRSLDDAWNVYTPPAAPRDPDMPTKNDIIEDITRVLPKNTWFSMEDLAREWLKRGTKKNQINICKVFGFEKGKGKHALIEILRTLVKRGIIVASEPLLEGFPKDRYTLYLVPKPKAEKYRNFDDDWE